MKKITLATFLLLLAAVPVLSALHAGDGAWESVQAEAAWMYDDYRVERLTFTVKAIGPFSLGEYVFVAEPAAGCSLMPCDKYQMYQLKDGNKLLIENIPLEALDPFRFALNENRLVYVNELQNDSHFAVVERDLDDGDTDILADDVFISGAEDVDVRVDGEDIYLEARLDYNGGSVEQSAVYVWDAAASEAEIIGKHWNLEVEHLLDAQDGVVLELLEFDGGETELWIGDTRNRNSSGMTRTAIPGTWTDGGEIVGAHFLSDGSIEYFQYFTRYTYDPDHGASVRHESEHLSWYRPIEDTYQMVGDRLAWIDDKDNLYVSDNGDVSLIGQAGWGKFHLEADRLFYGKNVAVAGTGKSTTLAGQVYDFATKKTTEMDYFVAGSAGSVYVGISPNTYLGYDRVYYLNNETGVTMYLGYGTDAAISDEDHVYWRGQDNNIYEATILPSAGSVQAMKVSGSPTVYLVEDGVRKTIPSEKVYFSYFMNWDSVQTVSTSVLNSYPLSGKAKFAPGTKVQFVGETKVYAVGEDGKLHWLRSPSVAYQVFGPTWAQGIVSVSMSEMVDYPIGDIIESESDISLL